MSVVSVPGGKVSIKFIPDSQGDETNSTPAPSPSSKKNVSGGSQKRRLIIIGICLIIMVIVRWVLPLLTGQH